MLYIVATPLGNLDDFSFRAIETLKLCDYILCEDTRHSQTLLHHYDIKKPLVSFHKFSEAAKEDKILEDLKAGKRIALISDAGTPGISDPGTYLITACTKNEITVSPIPGPSAAITALCCSGLPTDRFQFYGFLPKKSGELKKALQEILSYPGTTICYETPVRIQATLEILKELSPQRQLVLAKELTKKFEQFFRGDAENLLDIWKNSAQKGELVLLIEGKNEDDFEMWSAMTPTEHVAFLQKEYGMNQKEAVIAVAKLRGVPKREIYNRVHQAEDKISD